MTTPLPDDRRWPLQRFTPDDREHQAEQRRFLAERRARDATRKATWRAERTRRAERAPSAEEAAAPEETAG